MLIALSLQLLEAPRPHLSAFSDETWNQTKPVLVVTQKPHQCLDLGFTGSCRKQTGSTDFPQSTSKLSGFVSGVRLAFHLR
jgi:hypothetical protein